MAATAEIFDTAPRHLRGQAVVARVAIRDELAVDAQPQVLDLGRQVIVDQLHVLNCELLDSRSLITRTFQTGKLESIRNYCRSDVRNLRRNNGAGERTGPPHDSKRELPAVLTGARPAQSAANNNRGGDLRDKGNFSTDASLSALKNTHRRWEDCSRTFAEARAPFSEQRRGSTRAAIVAVKLKA